MFDKYNKIRMVALFVAVLLVAAACSGGGSSELDDSRPLVVVSIVPQAYFVKRLAGNLVSVNVMIPPGASPATYEPSMDQMMSLAKAKLYVKVGHENFPFEKVWLDKLLNGAPDVQVVDASKGIVSLQGDPHVWSSFVQASKIVSNIADGLKKILPDKVSEINANRDALQKEILSAHESAQKSFADLKGRKFFVFHSAWTYFANDYGLKQIVLEHGHKEPSPHHIQHVIEDAKAAGAKTIFAQPQMSKVSADMVAKEIGGSVLFIDPLAEDWLNGMKQATSSIAEVLSK